MNRFAAIICLLTFAWNIFLAGADYAFICTYVEGDRDSLQFLDESHSTLQACCPEHSQQRITSVCEPADCSYCIEIEVNSSDLEEANAQSQRLVLNVPLAVEYAPFVLRHSIRSSFLYFSKLSTQAPPTCRKASQEFSVSVRIIC